MIQLKNYLAYILYIKILVKSLDFDYLDRFEVDLNHL